MAARAGRRRCRRRARARARHRGADVRPLLHRRWRSPAAPAGRRAVLVDHPLAGARRRRARLPDPQPRCTFPRTTSRPRRPAARYAYNVGRADFDARSCWSSTPRATPPRCTPAACSRAPAPARRPRCTSSCLPDADAPAAARPLRGPAFGSYAAERGELAAHRPVRRRAGGADRGARGGDPVRRRALRRVAADRVPARAPSTRQLFDSALAASADRLAHAVGVVTELVLAERGPRRRCWSRWPGPARRSAS